MVAATALPVAFGGVALHGPCPVGSSGSCFQYVPMGAAMLSAAMLAAIAFLCMGFGSTTIGLEKDFESLEPADFDAIASLAATLPLVFDYAATVGPAALVPGVFAFAFAALLAIFAFRKRTSPSVSLEDDQDLDEFEADHNVWNDLLQLLVDHAVAPFLVLAFDDSSECCSALTCHFALDVFTVMQHGLPGALVDVEAVLSAAAPDLDDDKVTTQAAAASGAEVVLAFPLDDEVVSLSEEFFPQFFEGDTVNLAALSKAVNVSHEFLAGYVFEHGLGQPVSEIQAAAALDSDQLVKQAVAAREEEVSHFQKLGPSLQEKIQFFVKGDGATCVCHGQPSEPLSSVLELASGSHACHNGKCLDVGSSIEALGLFPGCTVRLYSRLRGGGPLDVPGQWQCGLCGAIRCWPTRNQCYKCEQPRSASSCSPRSSTYLDPQGMVGGLPRGFPGSSPLNLGMVHAPLGRGPPPKRSQTPPTSRRGPTVSPKPPPGAGTGYVRFDEGPLVPPPAPMSSQPVNQVLPPWASFWLFCPYPCWSGC